MWGDPGPAGGGVVSGRPTVLRRVELQRDQPLLLPPVLLTSRPRLSVTYSYQLRRLLPSRSRVTTTTTTRSDRYYWVRYDTEAKGYSLLAEADRKEKIEDIKETAFPKPAAMPNIPESADKVVMERC